MRHPIILAPSRRMLYFPVVTGLLRILLSPIGPALVLLLGAALQLIVGRWLRRSVLVRGLALLVVGAAGLIFLTLQFLNVAQPVSYTHLTLPTSDLV